MNVVDIVITGKNLAGPAFKQAEAQSAGMRSTMAKTGAIAGLALVGIGAASVHMATQFEASMTRLTTQAHVPQSQMKTLNDGVLHLAGSIGADPDSLSESLFHVESNFSSVGIKAPKALSLVETAAKGAKVGGADLVDVTNALTAAVASGIPGVQNFDQAMGTLNATVGAGDMTMQNLADAFSTGAVAQVKTYGLSIIDVGAALATFGDNNIRGQNAATQMRMAVQSMAVPAKGSADALEKLGLKSNTLAKDMQSGGLLKAVTDLKDHLDKAGISAKEQGQVLTEVFGKKAGTGINILVDQLGRLKSKYPELTKGANDFGDAWKKTQETTKQKLDQLQGAFEALAIKVGTRLLPVVTSLIGFLANHQNVFEGLALLVGITLVAAFGAWAVSVIAATWPVLAVIAAIVGLALAIKKVHDNWARIWSDILNAMKHPIAGILTALKSIGDAALETVIFTLRVFAAIPGIGAPFKRALKDVRSWKNDFDSTIQGAINTVERLGSAINSLPTEKTFTYHINQMGQVINQEGGVGNRQYGPALPGYGGSVGVSNKLSHIRAAGGPVPGAATGGPRGLAWVGEHGPELVSLPSGSMVRSNSDSARLAASGGGSQRIVLEINSGGSKMDDLLVEILRKSIRRLGGDVQVVLGRG